MSRAQNLMLDRCLDAKALDKIIYQMTSSAATRDMSKVSSQGSLDNLEYNIEGFAKFLTSSKAINTLLFWKDAEEYSALFGSEERKAYAEKVFKRYLEIGAAFEVTSLQGEHCKRIKEELADSPNEELFLPLQQEAYGIMLFDLFPRFWEAVKEQDMISKKKGTTLTADTNLSDVLAQDGIEIHLFAEYCREHLCEDSIIFLLEAKSFQLLFDPRDRLAEARRIFETFLDMGSESRIAASNSVVAECKTAIEEAEKDESKALNSDLLDRMCGEVTSTLNMDVWPRYKEAVLSGAELRLSSLTQASGEKYVDMTKPSKKAVAAILRNPDKLAHLRKVAEAQGVKEAVEFCVACYEFKLLFSEADRKPRSKVIYDTYLSPGADSPVNIPDTMIRQVENDLKTGPVTDFVFEQAAQEVAQVIADNLFSHYLKAIEQAEEEKQAPAPAVAPPPQGGGGCCVLQ